MVEEYQEEWQQEVRVQEDQQQQLAGADQEEQPRDQEQQQLPGVDEEEQQQDGAEQRQHELDPIYAELEPRALLPPAPVRRQRSRRGHSDPQLPTRFSGRFRGLGDEPLASLPYTGRPL